MKSRDRYFVGALFQKADLIRRLKCKLHKTRLKCPFSRKFQFKPNKASSATLSRHYINPTPGRPVCPQCMHPLIMDCAISSSTTVQMLELESMSSVKKIHEHV